MDYENNVLPSSTLVCVCVERLHKGKVFLKHRKRLSPNTSILLKQNEYIHPPAKERRVRMCALLFIVSFLTSQIAGVISMPRFISPHPSACRSQSPTVLLLALSSASDGSERNLQCHFPLDVEMKITVLYRK